MIHPESMKETRASYIPIVQEANKTVETEATVVWQEGQQLLWSKNSQENIKGRAKIAVAKRFIESGYKLEEK